ncbi:MAG: leucine--tRNA ligase, partial [Candidatus Doudnabacteria bacterium]|nr:leucine--tRNA ligase [Candidatus Doudnabacteria bacterium]
WRHDAATDPEVTQREVKQWFFKITDYADELLEATDALDWTETVKTAQKNWIGKSEGVMFTFTVKDLGLELQSYDSVPQTFMAQTFAVIAPEHPMVKELVEGTEHEKPVLEMVDKIRKRKLKDKFDVEKDIEGIFTGRYLANPFGTGDLPIWIASFVVADYGGGFVTCSAHDERDFAFAKKYNIPLRPVMFPQDPTLAAQVRNLEYCYHHDPEGVLEQAPEGLVGKTWGEAREPIIAHIEQKGMGVRSVQYKMRDWSVSRQRYWGAPIPIIYCKECGPQLVPDADLPVVLPELKDFSPSGDGRSALARAVDWVKVVCPKCGSEGERETDTLDTYICSSWYMLRYFDPRNAEKPFEPDTVNKWMPIDFYNGADHATAHMLYARFVTRFFYKKGLIENPEPFKKFLFNGKVTASDGTMFSKSKGNGVDPLEIIPEYGADALRTYLMFAAPLDIWIKWDPQGVPSALRFLNRIWVLVQEFIAAAESVTENETVLRAVHKTIKKVTTDLESQKYNTAIASMMELVNTLNAEKMERNFVGTNAWRFAMESLVQLIAPFAPHMADELWEALGHTDSAQKGHWPAWDEALIRESMVTVIVQVNGKIRGKLSVPVGSPEDTVTAAALAEEKVKLAVGGNPIRKTIFVADKLLNLVV